MTDEYVQNYTAVDSPPTDPFEALVAAYYQLQGYITSSAKWFWVRDPVKTQRGYQDIDVLAINAQETIIVSVTGNLDDKLNLSIDQSASRQLEYFQRVTRYLKNTDKYEWLLDRPIKYVIAYANGKSLEEKLKENTRWQETGIILLYSGDVIQALQLRINDRERPFKTNNQLIKLLQIVSWRDRDTLKKPRGSKKPPKTNL